MKTERGFRIPEPRDKAIQWPERRGETQRTAIYDYQSAAWLVTGYNAAYGNPFELVKMLGNDWYVVHIDRVPEAVKS